MSGEKGTLYFFTGLAGAGKNTIGGLFYQRLKERKPDAVLIDGHKKRESVGTTVVGRGDYSNAARLAGARGMFQSCCQLTNEGHDVVCCSMSLFDEIRDWNRKHFEHYYEIFLDVDMDTLRSRRTELYNSSKDVVGVHLPWEAPKSPDIVIENDGRETPEAIVERLWREFNLLNDTEIGMAEQTNKSVEGQIAYHDFAILDSLYRCLEDDLSKRVFIARLACDLSPTSENIRQLTCLRNGYTDDKALFSKRRLECLLTFASEQEPVIIYGTAGQGRLLARLLRDKGIDLFGFCGRRSSEFRKGLMGMPVVGPEWLKSRLGEYGVIVASTFCYDEIFEIIDGMEYPRTKVFSLPYTDTYYVSELPEDQYFEFPEAYRAGTSFVDGGCFDGTTSIQFAKWCNGHYKSIFAFEPDPDSYLVCRRNIKDSGLKDVTLLNVGLSDTDGETVFLKGVHGQSRIAKTVESGTTHVQTVQLDQVLCSEKVGFIKLDIEGAEYSALLGAEGIIRRDRPMMAVCVYHKPGDMLAVLSYLRGIVPDYHFFLRQYGGEAGLGVSAAEMVLYAFI